MSSALILPGLVHEPPDPEPANLGPEDRVYVAQPVEVILAPVLPWQTVLPVVVGAEAFVRTTSSEEMAPQVLVIVHLNVALVPAATPVTPEVGEDGEVMLADPLTTLHVPDPDPGVFPARVKLPLLQFI